MFSNIYSTCFLNSFYRKNVFIFLIKNIKKITSNVRLNSIQSIDLDVYKNKKRKNELPFKDFNKSKRERYFFIIVYILINYYFIYYVIIDYRNNVDVNYKVIAPFFSD